MSDEGISVANPSSGRGCASALHFSASGGGLVAAVVAEGTPAVALVAV